MNKKAGGSTAGIALTSLISMAGILVAFSAINPGRIDAARVDL